ncbi:hypothetical protein Dda_7436 [Drechslerella dactyloides]|uniref:Uncharacterized protein n=1 Tax=Drechslerella dactyloides TaxID=74499 RepID=A0AAD6NGS1_DREDA|nr:hypothetical protein Dda_7436 [Drechslerella dactyloides]
MPRPTDRLSTLPPFSHQARHSVDDSSLPTIPHPPSPPSDPQLATAAVGTAANPPFLVQRRYSAIPLISSVAEPAPNAAVEAFPYTNHLNTGVYNSLSRIPSYRLPSPVSLPSRHDSRIQRDRGMSVSPVSSISSIDAPLTSRYSYLIQPLSGIPQSPALSEMSRPTSPPPLPPAIPLPPPLLSSQDEQPLETSSMGLPLDGVYFPPGPESLAAGLHLPPMNESSSNIAGSSNRGIEPASPDTVPVVTYGIPLRPEATDALPTPPRNIFQHMHNSTSQGFGRLHSRMFGEHRPSRPLSISQFVRRHRMLSSHPPTPALAIIGLVTSVLVFIALMVFLWVSTFAANIVAIVYSFSVLIACTFVLVEYKQKKRRSESDEERGSSGLSLFGRGRGGTSGDTGSQPEMDIVQASEIIVIPRMPVHRVVGEGEADPELPPYSRGGAAEILDISAPPPPLDR